VESARAVTPITTSPARRVMDRAIQDLEDCFSHSQPRHRRWEFRHLGARSYGRRSRPRGHYRGDRRCACRIRHVSYRRASSCFPQSGVGYGVRHSDRLMVARHPLASTARCKQARTISATHGRSHLRTGRRSTLSGARDLSSSTSGNHDRRLAERPVSARVRPRTCGCAQRSRQVGISSRRTSASAITNRWRSSRR
jgi:hypothetical protein